MNSLEPSKTTTLNQDVYLKSDAVRRRFGHCSHMWIVRRMSDPVNPFPKPTTFGGKQRFWKLVDIVAWEKARSTMPGVSS
jgi:predicted DNA-binding transcriptional regulator AlpA